jgi:hypothetical protein
MAAPGEGEREGRRRTWWWCGSLAAEESAAATMGIEIGLAVAVLGDETKEGWYG